MEEIAERDGWLCWVCDEPVDPQMSVNDGRGPSIDARGGGSKPARGAGGRKVTDGEQRLAHRGCNTRKGAVKAVIPWPERLFVSDPAPLLGVAERLTRKPGREVVARCPGRADADQTAEWLVDRFLRLVPQLSVRATIEPGGGQYLVALVADR